MRPPLAADLSSVKVTGVRITRGLVELLTDTELTGIAIGADVPAPSIESLVKDVLIGADPRGVRALWQRMTESRSRPDAIATLDGALWDLKARANDEPLWKTLGGARPNANAYASGNDLAWFGVMARDYGLRSGKLKVGAHAGRDLERLAQLRSTLMQGTSEPPVLMIDAGERWSPAETIRRTLEIEAQFDLTWVEGAARRSDCLGLKQVSDAIGAAVCVGDGLASCAEFLPHLLQRSADVLQIDVGLVGITGALQLADAAFGYEIPVTLAAVPGNIQVHLAGAMPYFMSTEIIDPAQVTPLYTSDVRVEKGRAIAGDAPGNGLAVRVPA
jgi:L-alanine-DL-glutamate epimerase-like enolase superfamily enzyme